MRSQTDMDDRALPTEADSERTHEHYPRWSGIAPLPNARMMLHVGAETVENFLVVGDAWGQLVASLLTPDSRVLDIGCGCGRTARTLLHDTRIVRYIGFDVVAPYIAWNNRFLAPLTGGRFVFRHLDVVTPRYNPTGTQRDVEVTFPVEDASMTLAFGASLFTHLREGAAVRYLREARRVLRPDGRLLVSIHDKPADGATHSGDEFRADFAPAHFIALASDCGFPNTRAIGDICGQETFVFSA